MIKIWCSFLLVLSATSYAATPSPEEGCAGPLTEDGVETSEVEVKYLIPDLTQLPTPVIEALHQGQPHALVPRRGLVLQEYLEVSPENLRELYVLMARAKIPFGTREQQLAFVKPGVAREIRLMTKSILQDGNLLELRQVTIKGAGGVAVVQIESPEVLNHARAVALRQVFDKLRSLVTSRVRKLYFETLDREHAVEVDIFLGASGIAAPPIFTNGEVEFHGPSIEAATAKAHAYQDTPGARASYFGPDLTNLEGLKSRDLARGRVPEAITRMLKPTRSNNYAFARALARDFERWADPDLVSRVLYPPVDLNVNMVTPTVHEVSDLANITAAFRSDGYVVVDHVSDEGDRAALIGLIDRVTAAGSDTRRLGFLDLYHDHAFARLRQNPALYAVFTRLFDTERLWVVFDRVMYWRQTEPESPLPPHVDQNPITHPDFFAAQGMLALKDMNEGTGTLAVAIGSHREFDRYAPMTSEGAGHVEFEGESPWQYQGLRLRAGQMVIWDSRLTHGRIRLTPDADRYAALITFAPAVDDEDVRLRRVDAFRSGAGVSDPAAGLRATARPRFEGSLRERPEELTPLGRKLYGVDSWFTP